MVTVKNHLYESQGVPIFIGTRLSFRCRHREIYLVPFSPSEQGNFNDWECFNHYAKAQKAVRRVTKRQNRLRAYFPISGSNLRPLVIRISSVRGLM